MSLSAEERTEEVYEEPTRELKGTRISLKEASKLKNILSAGRKRANKIKPILPGDVCEWSMKKNVGGGPIPIVGCPNNKAATVHHGPDKSVINNSLENLHKICTSCHARWHARNDAFYLPDRPENGEPYLPIEEYERLEPEEATAEEIIDNELAWEKK